MGKEASKFGVHIEGSMVWTLDVPSKAPEPTGFPMGLGIGPEVLQKFRSGGGGGSGDHRIGAHRIYFDTRVLMSFLPNHQ